MPKLRNVPANTYSVLAVSVSLNRKIDLAATIKPIASNCPSNTNTMVSNRSKLPINAPAFFILSQDADSPTWYFSKINLMRILAGFIHKRIANIKSGVENELGLSIIWKGNSFVVS